MLGQIEDILQAMFIDNVGVNFFVVVQFGCILRDYVVAASMINSNFSYLSKMA